MEFGEVKSIAKPLRPYLKTQRGGNYKISDLSFTVTPPFEILQGFIRIEPGHDANFFVNGQFANDLFNKVLSGKILTFEYKTPILFENEFLVSINLVKE